MKKLITLVAIFSVIGLSAFAGNGPLEVKKYFSQNFNYRLSFSKIVVEDDIDLVIYENASSNIQFDGNKEDIAKVEWNVKNGTLYLKSKNGSLKNKVIATIDVTNLTEVLLEGESSVRSLGNLNSPTLNVFMKGGCYVAIKNYGTINIISMEETEMNIMERKGNVSIG